MLLNCHLGRLCRARSKVSDPWAARCQWNTDLECRARRWIRSTAFEKRLVALSSDLECYMLSCCDQLIVCAQKSSPDNYQLKKARICIFAASFIFGGAHLNWDKSFTLHCFFVLSSSLWSDPSRIVHPQRWHVPSQILNRCHNFPLKTWHLFN